MGKGAMLSLCMIVRDEAELLSDCLQSVHRYVDEIIIGDTGSTDNTRELALRWGARVVEVPWRDDFSAARNAVLNLTEGDWVLILDADERLIVRPPLDLADLLGPTEIEAYSLPVKNVLNGHGDFSSDIVVRLFRNRPEYRFAGRLHEQILPAIIARAGKNSVATAPLTILHLGNQPNIRCRKGKYERNVRILRDACTQNPEDSFINYCLGLEYLNAGKYTDAADAVWAGIVKMQGHEGYFLDALTAYGLALSGSRQWNKLGDFLAQAIPMAPNKVDLNYLNYLFCQVTGDKAGAAECVRRVGGETK